MVNSPLPTDLAGECRKAAKIIEQFVKPEKSSGPDQLIPPHIITNAKGLAVLSVIKAGFLFTGRAGSGLVIARLDDGSWSAPSAIGTAGMGVGGQIGAELTDFVIILNTRDAVRAFSHGGNVTLGGNLSVAAGPVGRNVEASGAVANFAAIYSYSKTRGLFAGVSLEGSVILERKEANQAFYHRKVSAKELLAGNVPPPPAAEPLYRALNRRVMRDDYDDPYQPSSSANDYYAAAAQPAASRPTSYGPYGTQAPQDPLHGGGFLSDNKPAASRPAPPPPIPKKPTVNPGMPTATALYDFAGERDGDLGFRRGDVITIVKRTQSTNDWWTGRCHGKEGQFPANYVEIIN